MLGGIQISPIRLWSLHCVFQPPQLCHTDNDKDNLSWNVDKPVSQSYRKSKFNYCQFIQWGLHYILHYSTTESNTHRTCSQTLQYHILYHCKTDTEKCYITFKRTDSMQSAVFHEDNTLTSDLRTTTKIQYTHCHVITLRFNERPDNTFFLILLCKMSRDMTIRMLVLDISNKMWALESKAIFNLT